MQLLINVLLVHIVLAYLARFIVLYLPNLSDNPVVDLLSMNERKIVTSSVMILFTVWIASHLKIKELYKLI